jgi:glycopeptide antibiotics resistance protein
MATGVALLTILACTLFPYHVSVRESCVPFGWAALLIPIGPDKTLDVIANVLLFAPLGFAMAGYFTGRRIKAVASVTGVLVVSLCVSYSVELIQLFMPGRFTSLTDVLSNTAGAGVGVLCHSAWRRCRQRNGRLACMRP